MQITKKQSTDLNTLILTIYVNEEDYKTQLEKLIKEKKKNVQINGFRKGAVSIDIIRNQYHNQLKLQCIQKLLNQYIYDYIYKEKIEILGDILLIKQEIIDKNNMLFNFEIGLIPNFDLIINTFNIYYYNILFSDEEIHKYIIKIKSNTIFNDFMINSKNIITSEKDFIYQVKLELKKIYDMKSNELLFNSLITIILKDTKIHFPKNFLQRWIANKYSMSIEQVKKQYQNIEKTIAQQLILNKLYIIYDIKNTQLQNQQEININNLTLENIVKKIIKNEHNIDIISNSNFHNTISILKEKLNIKNQECSLSKFQELLSTN